MEGQPALLEGVEQTLGVPTVGMLEFRNEASSITLSELFSDMVPKVFMVDVEDIVLESFFDGRGSLIMSLFGFAGGNLETSMGLTNWMSFSEVRLVLLMSLKFFAFRIKFIPLLPELD